MIATTWLPDFTPILRLRGFLTKPAFKKCGKNFQIASGTIINYTSQISIGNNVFIANNCWVQGIGEVVIEDEVMLGPFTVVASSNHTKQNGSYRYGTNERKKITMRHGCWTGAHAVLTAGVVIGKGSAVAANAVVTKNVQDNCIVGGVPAKVIRQGTV